MFPVPNDGEPIVLILVVMEEGQRPTMRDGQATPLTSLNPCCNGRGSKTYCYSHDIDDYDVLILVVMEEGQRPGKVIRIKSVTPGLNPCCNGRGSKTLYASTRACPGRRDVLILVVMEEGQRRTTH